MKFVPNHLYHVYNQGNNHEQLFFNNNQYKHFLQLFHGYVLPNCEVLSYCLMPNHFHFQLYMDERCTVMRPQGGLLLDPVTNGFRKLLSAYAHAFNNKNDRSGALFRPKTKAKCLSEEAMISNTIYSLSDYYTNCFHYIHHNPDKAGLVDKAADWPWSSYNFYYGNGEDFLCNRELASKYCRFEDSKEMPGSDLINYV